MKAAYKQRKAEGDYETFLSTLHRTGWWIGLAPLEKHNFNKCKTDTKWVEYSLCGIPVVASSVKVYERSCIEGCGVRIRTEDDWYVMLRRLIENKRERSGLVERAQKKLVSHYHYDRLVQQTLDIIEGGAAAVAFGRRSARRAEDQFSDIRRPPRLRA